MTGDCAECARYRREAYLAKEETKRVLRFGNWRVVIASVLDEARTRLLHGRVGEY